MRNLSSPIGAWDDRNEWNRQKLNQYFSCNLPSLFKLSFISWVYTSRVRWWTGGSRWSVITDSTRASRTCWTTRSSWISRAEFNQKQCKSVRFSKNISVKNKWKCKKETGRKYLLLEMRFIFWRQVRNSCISLLHWIHYVDFYMTRKV